MDGARQCTAALCTPRCTTDGCRPCVSALLTALQAQATSLTVDIIDPPCAEGLIAQAEALAIALKESPLVSLRRLVDDFASAAAIAQQRLAAKESA